jgi:hypothetical protein
MPKRILIVDDNEDIRRVIRWFLESRTTCEVCGEAVSGLTPSKRLERFIPFNSLGLFDACNERHRSRSRLKGDVA